MKIAVSLIAGLTLSVFTGFAQDANAIVKKVRDKLNTVKDYEADGKLVTNVSFMKVPDSKVTVYYKNPDKFKIRKQDGISIVPKGGTSVNLNSLFAGGGEFTAVAAGKTAFRGKELTVVKMLPLAENSDVVVSTLYVDEAASLIHKAITTTKESGTYEIEMTYGKYATWGLPDQVTFIFNTKNYKLPKGLAFDYDTGEKPAVANKGGDQQGRVQISYTSYKINKGIAASVFGS
ncbi:MAG: hypothetical protein EOO02_00695 [Chitinophagaceae bacterium]|nr:MAG: hypothetical protein EOO02_00695 [Chitinophagaceae bacterium]